MDRFEAMRTLVAAIDGGATAIHIEAVEPTLVGVLSQEQLKVVLARHPDVAFAILVQLAQRLRRFVDLAAKESMSHMTSLHRH